MNYAVTVPDDVHKKLKKLEPEVKILGAADKKPE